MATVKTRSNRAELTDAVLLAMRESSGLGVLHSQAIAERMGVSSTDLECLDIIAMRGPIAAGELARASGLTTGAITGLIDRLERAGFAQRETDAEDRRKVLIRATPRAEREGAALARPMHEAMTKLVARYDDATLGVLLDLLQRTNEAARDAIQALKASAARPRRPLARPK